MGNSFECEGQFGHNDLDCHVMTTEQKLKKSKSSKLLLSNYDTK